jgi:hypothetical protein
MDLDVGAGLGGGDEPQADLTVILLVAVDVSTIRPSLGLAPTKHYDAMHAYPPN